MRMLSLVAAVGAAWLAYPVYTLVVPARAATLGASVSDAAQPTVAPSHLADPGPWKSLFDGKSMSSWRGYKSDTVPSGWRIVGDAMTKDDPTGDLISREQFGDFELELEWKIGTAGNSGIFYRGNEEFPKIYWTAPEMQVLDDEKAADNKSRLTSAGAAYGLYPSPAGVVKPANEWNAVRIIAKGPHVEHWLNGRKIVEYELWSPDWEAKVKASKFAEWPQYGRLKRGHLALQGDHEGELAFRRIRIREL